MNIEVFLNSAAPLASTDRKASSIADASQQICNPMPPPPAVAFNMTWDDEPAA
jgi:hypothetical protein